MSMKQAARERSAVRVRARWSAELIVAGTVVAVAAAVWVLLARIAGPDLKVGTGGSVQEAGLANVVVVSALVAVLGTTSLRAAEAILVRGRRWWTVLALAILAISLLGPLSAETTGAVAGLICLHAVVGGIVVAGLRRVSRKA